MSDGADDREIAWTETMAAAGWPDPFDLDDEMDWRREQEQAFWASPKGVALQLAQFHSERGLAAGAGTDEEQP